MILLDIRLSRTEERCTLIHEIVHTERRPFSLWLTAEEEAAVSVEAALWFSPRCPGRDPRLVVASRGRRFGGSRGIRGPNRPEIRDEPQLD